MGALQQLMREIPAARETTHPPEQIKPGDFDYAAEDRAIATLQ